jgi:hypothetical protein
MAPKAIQDKKKALIKSKSSFVRAQELLSNVWKQEFKNPRKRKTNFKLLRNLMIFSGATYVFHSYGDLFAI